MRILALDTSTPFLSCALVSGDEVLAEAVHGPPAKAGDLLPQALLDLCARAGLGLDDVSGIAVGIGPGSFTGLRVGLASAKALSYARRLPIAGASSLRALAHGRSGVVCAALEARRGEVFAALFQDGEPTGAARALRFEGLRELLRQHPDAVLVGHGARENRRELAGLRILDDVLAPPASAVARLCRGELEGARFDAARCFSLAPDYLQPSTAEVALAEGRVGGLGPKLA